jgi:preprotein translocase subunit SecF
MKLLRLAPENTKFGFMRFRRISYPFSAVMSILSVVLFLTVGMNFGIDFSGGTVIEVRANSGIADLAQLRATTEKMGVGDVEVQSFGSPEEVVLRFGLQPGGDAAQEAAVTRVKTAIGDGYEVRRTEVVGPRVSGELVQSGTLGVVVSILAVRVAIRGWRHYRHHARSSADRRLLRDYAPRVQHNIHRGDLDDCRLLAERDGCGARPYPRNDEKIPQNANG